MLNSKLLFFVSIPVLLLASALVLVSNEFLYFSEFKNSVEIELFGGSADGMSQAVSKISSLPNIAKLDRSRGGVPTFQNLTVEELQTFYDEILSNIDDAPSYHVRETLRAELNYVESYLITIVSFGFFFILSHFFFVVRNEKSITKFNDVLGFYLIYALGAFIASLLSIGFLSLLSTQYMVKELELTLSFLGLFAWSIVFLISSRKTISEEFRLDILSRNLFKITKNLQSKLIFVLVSLIFFVIILSENFIIPGVIISVNFLISIAVSKWLGLLLRLDKQKISNKLNSWKKEERMVSGEKGESRTSKQSIKKKAKKKNVKNRI